MLNRVRHSTNWQVQLIGEKDYHISSTGIKISMHASLDTANSTNAVSFASGKGTHEKVNGLSFLQYFKLNPKQQLISSMYLGALILAALELLEGKTATIYATVNNLLESFGVTVLEKPFVLEGNVATAAGCLAAQYLVG